MEQQCDWVIETALFIKNLTTMRTEKERKVTRNNGRNLATQKGHICKKSRLCYEYIEYT